nr:MULTISPECIES: iron-containing alcohol dehydrogenase [Chelativorans]
MKSEQLSSVGVMRAPRHVVFGAGQRRSLPGFTLPMGQNIVIVTDTRLESERDFGEIVDGLKAQGHSVSVFAGVEPELPDRSVAAGASVASRASADMIVGIGGGSCIDAAKFIALLAAHGGRPSDYYGEFKVPGPVMPLVAIPTTAGTGSEVTPVAVISDADRTLKVGVASPYLIPQVAICDPELTYSCPPGLTAVSGADALTHAIEAFTTRTHSPSPSIAHENVFIGKNILSDQFALQAITRIGRSLEAAVADGTDTSARSDLMYGSLLAGLAFGVAGTSAAHAVQYPVGALTHTAHGAGVAVMLPYVMEFNRRHCTQELVEVADALGVATSGAEPASNALAAIDRVRNLCAAIGIPPTLEALGLTPDQVGWTVENALGAQRLVKNNPRPLDQESMQLLVEAAFSGYIGSLNS